MNDIANLIAKIEGKRKQISIAQVKEVLGIVADCAYLYDGVAASLVSLGQRRAKSKKSKLK